MEHAVCEVEPHFRDDHVQGNLEKYFLVPNPIVEFLQAVSVGSRIKPVPRIFVKGTAYKEDNEYHIERGQKYQVLSFLAREVALGLKLASFQ